MRHSQSVVFVALTLLILRFYLLLSSWRQLMALRTTLLKSAARHPRKGFTLIELAIVGLFLGLLAVFAITQFTGAAADSVKANSLYEASLKLGTGWQALVLNCGVNPDITATPVGSGGAASTAGQNLSMLLGSASASATYAKCVSDSGIKPLSGLSTGAAGAESIQGFPVTLTGALVQGRPAMLVNFSNVPETVFMGLYNKHSATNGADTTSSVAATTSETNDVMLRFTASAAGSRTVTVIMTP